MSTTVPSHHAQAAPTAADRPLPSPRVEAAFVDALEEMCRRENRRRDDILRAIEMRRGIIGRASALRTVVLDYFHTVFHECRDPVAFAADRFDGGHLDRALAKLESQAMAAARAKG